MRYPAAETAQKHERILNEASKLFLERGFTGVSVAEIMKAAQLTHGPFYNHFDSKEALMTAGVEHIMETTLVPVTASRGARNAKAKYLARYLSSEHRDDPGSGCAMPALAADISREPNLKPLFTARVKMAVDAFASCFTWKSKRTVRSESIQFLAATVGAVVLARAVDDPVFSKEILDTVKKGLSQ